MEKTKNLDKTACAYKEIYEILKIFPNELVSRIPKEKIEFFYNNMDKNYEYKISKETFDGRTMLEETAAILTILFRDYWASAEQKEKIISYTRSAKYMGENTSREEYSVNNRLRELNKYENKEKSETTKEIVQYKETLFQKIKNKILRMFGLK